MISWSAFWISPKALMPRFASGFISFLAMQGFKTYAASLMPNKGKIPTTSWIDIYISMSGILMGMSVVETVVVQFINENISHRAATYVDFVARGGFPLVFIVLLGLMFVVTDIDILNVAINVCLVLFIVAFVVFAIIEAYMFPVFIISRSLNHTKPKRGSRVFEEWQLEEHELQIIFDRVCHIGPGKEEEGFANTARFGKWLQKWKPALYKHPDVFPFLLQKHFGERFHYPTFKEQFPQFLTDTERMLIGLQTVVDSDERLVRQSSTLTNGSTTHRMIKVDNPVDV
jgi:hypothetical protein